jgi:hypothetical protein
MAGGHEFHLQQDGVSSFPCLAFAAFPPFVQQLLLTGLVVFSASPIGILIGVLLDLSRRLHGPHPQAAQLNLSYNEDDLNRVSYVDINMLNAMPHEPTHAGYVVIRGSGFVGRCVLHPVYHCTWLS